ncbi:MAG: DUF1592 domain-containing protein [Planctomycetota bacterium]|nr:DUF1592 domain-containing protein [Planctomycetota bacterium]
MIRHSLARISCPHRLLPGLLFFVIWKATLVIAQGPVQPLDNRKQVRPFLVKYCFRCHGNQKQEAELRLDRLGTDFAKQTDAETWHDVLKQLNLGEMPPENQDQPTAKELEAITGWLQNEMSLAAAAKRATGGQVILRRLTRYEYNNTLQDLLGIEFNFAEDLPPEPMSKDGFQNSGQALGMSPLQLEIYQKVARLALGKAIVSGPKPRVHRVTARTSLKLKKTATGNQIGPDGAFVSRIMDYPREGEIVIRVKAGAMIPQGAGDPPMRVTCGMKSDVLTAESIVGTVDVTASDQAPEVYEFRARMEQFPLPGHNPKFPGVMITVRNDYPSANQGRKKNRKKNQSPTPPDPTVPTIVIESVEFEGPFFEQWPPSHHAKIFFQKDPLDDEITYGRKVIERFASRSYRRPVRKEELEILVSFFKRIRPDYPTFEAAIRETLAMVLVSPQFLYLIEPQGRAKNFQPLNDFELASRLSYFLWSSMPDDRLIRLAKKGQLRNPGVLERQVIEMLASPKSEDFVENFVEQWLNLSGLNRVAVNPEYYPDFDDRLKVHMRRETISFFGEILRSNLSALNLIDSDFAMLNQPLARHYGLSGPRGSRFERVALHPDDRRGGLLTQGSILLSHSTGEDSHPIRRAVWLLDRLLDSPPSPPPPDVPELDSEKPGFSSLSLKKQLELHRQKKSCNNCHRKIDPWGIPFENYDATGQWRTEVLRVTKKGPDKRSPVVANSILPSGEPIDGLAELKTHLLDNEQERFARALVTKLLTYALGRSLELADEGVVVSLTREFKDNNFKLSRLIIAIVQSEPFQFK